MPFFIRTSFYFVILLFFAAACTKDKVDSDCGCDGSTNRTIENLPARYAGNGNFLVADTNGDFLHVSACDVDLSWEVSKNEKIWNYIICGDIKKTCPGPNPELELPLPGGPIRLAYIKKM